MKKKDMSLALWAGGFRVQMGTQTDGSINLSGLLPIDQWKDKINTGYTKVAEHQQEVDNWWNSLSNAQQQNPVNKAKHDAANAVLTRFGSILGQASQAVNGASDASVQYSLQKRQKEAWNFLLGGQYQYNRDWMLRLEVGFLGARTQVIAGLQYRFNL